MTPSPPTPSRAPTPGTVNLLIGVLCLIWGSTWVVIKNGLDDLPPFTSAALRVAVATVVMAGVAAALHRREGGRRPPFWLSGMLGTTNFAASYAIIYWCETRLPSGLMSILWAVFPLLIAVSAHFVLHDEPLRVRQLIGLVLGFAGVVFLHSTDVSALGGDARFAALVLMLSPLVSTVGTLVVKRQGSDVNSLLLNRNAMAVSTVLLAAPALLLERDADVRWTASAIFSLGYLSVVGTVLTFSMYYWLMRYAPATKMSLIAYITPMLALFYGAMLRDEVVGLWTLTGSAMILGGVALAAKPRPPGAGAAPGAASGR